MLTVTVRSKRDGDAAAHLKKVRRGIEGPQTVRVGWFAEKLAMIALYNEFGTRRGIPSRPFFRTAMQLNERRYGEVMVAEAKKIFGGSGGTVRDALNRLGMRAVADVQKSIGSNIPPPNRPATIKRKGSSRTLIDTGAMRQGVSYELD